jgi:hypothetical protein
VVFDVTAVETAPADVDDADDDVGLLVVVPLDDIILFRGNICSISTSGSFTKAAIRL